MTQKTITVVGSDDVKAELAKLGKDAPEAVRIATTLIGERAQREMRQKLPTRFTFRGTAEAFSRAIIFQAPRASATRKMTAMLKVGSDTGGTKATATRNLGVLLARHEEPDSRTETGQVVFDGRGRPMTGLGFFLPANGLRTRATNPPRKYYPSSIGAALRRTPDNRVLLAKGTKKGSKSRGTGESFFATRLGIFRRRHTSFGGRAEVQAVWWFTRTIRTPARLALWETAESVFDRFAVAMTFDAIDIVLERTSPKGLR